MEPFSIPLRLLSWMLLLISWTAGSANAETPQEIAKKAFRSTLLLATEDAKNQPVALGSGFFVGEGRVATNLHVLKGSARGYAKPVGGKVKYYIEGIAAVDAARDLVILKVSAISSPVLPLGDSDAMQVGDTVYAVGNPQGMEGTFSQGIVSGIRDVGLAKVLQITAPISPGSSGGPVLNEKGEVIGVSFAALTEGQNLNFAIPSESLKALLGRKDSVILDSATTEDPVPRVVVPPWSHPAGPVVPPASPAARLYAWRLHVAVALFWVGEQPSTRNSAANHESSWDQNWKANFGGYDDPEPAKRIADFKTGEFRPRAFVPKLNPFYVALPYNDVVGNHHHKPEASEVIPWFEQMHPKPGESVCKGRWVQIYNGRRSCYAQWEDCGPMVTDDWEYVFGKKAPKMMQNGAAGMSISPSVRDYLAMESGKMVHWRFVEAEQVPPGPWNKYGSAKTATTSPLAPGQRRSDNADLEMQRRYLEYLKKLRDKEYLKSPMSEMQR